LEQLATNPRNIAVQSLDVAFSEPIDPTTFDWQDLTLTRDGGANLITSDVTVTPLTPSSFRIGNFSWVQGYAGTYSFTVNAATVADLAGNPGSGSSHETWLLSLTAPASPTNLFIAPDLGISATDGLTSTNSLTLAGTVGASNLTVRAKDTTTGSDLGTATVIGTNFSAFLQFTVEGTHHLQVNAVDAAGNVSAPSFFDLFLDLVPPTAIIQQVTSPTYSDVASISVVFSKPINTNTLSPTNFVVTVNSGSPFTPAVTRLSSNVFLIGNLAAYTAPIGTYQVTLNLRGIQDLAGNQTTDLVTMSWVHSLQLPPVLVQVTNRNIRVGETITITNYAQVATPPVAFSLDHSAPAGAGITTNGIFNWTPACLQGSTTNLITIWATDSSTPPLSNSMTFTVIVGECVELGIGSTVIQAGHTNGVAVTLMSSLGLTNLNWTLVAPPDRFTNWGFASSNAAIATALVQPIDASQILFSLGARAGATLQSPSLLGTLFFTALPGPSAFLPLATTNILGRKTDGSTVGNIAGQSGRVVVIGPQPLLEAWIATNHRMLTIYGNPGASYETLFTTNLLATNWLAGWRIPQTNLAQTYEANEQLQPVFYRAVQFAANPPILELNSFSSTNLTLLLYGISGTNYAIQATTNLSLANGWFPATNIELTNSFEFISAGDQTNSVMVFRAKRP
jgi:hypothetical protein